MSIFKRTETIEPSQVANKLYGDRQTRVIAKKLDDNPVPPIVIDRVLTAASLDLDDGAFKYVRTLDQLESNLSLSPEEISAVRILRCAHFLIAAHMITSENEYRLPVSDPSHLDQRTTALTIAATAINRVNGLYASISQPDHTSDYTNFIIQLKPEA